MNFHPILPTILEGLQAHRAIIETRILQVKALMGPAAPVSVEELVHSLHEPLPRHIHRRRPRFVDVLPFEEEKPAKKRRQLSKKGRANIIAGAKRRWAAYYAEMKKLARKRK